MTRLDQILEILNFGFPSTTQRSILVAELEDILEKQENQEAASLYAGKSESFNTAALLAESLQNSQEAPNSFLEPTPSKQIASPFEDKENLDIKYPSRKRKRRP